MRTVTHHLEPVSPELGESSFEQAEDPFGPEWFEPIPRPSWWRWVALVVIVAMVLATPIAYAIDRLVD